MGSAIYTGRTTNGFMDSAIYIGHTTNGGAKRSNKKKNNLY